jgi:hypothetical protein
VRRVIGIKNWSRYVKRLTGVGGHNLYLNSAKPELGLRLFSVLEHQLVKLTFASAI